MQLIVTSYHKEEVICSFIDGGTGASHVFSHCTTWRPHGVSGFAHRNSTKRLRPFKRSSPYVKEKVRLAVSR